MRLIKPSCSSRSSAPMVKASGRPGESAYFEALRTAIDRPGPMGVRATVPCPGLSDAIRPQAILIEPRGGSLNSWILSYSSNFRTRVLRSIPVRTVSKP